MKRLKVCIVGAGQFSPCFIPLYQAHPWVGEVALCESHPGRLSEVGDLFGLTMRYRDFGEVLRSDIDAVALFTSRWSHAPLALQALQEGKHVYSAVPAATTLEELQALIEAVRRTGLIYMLGETSHYYGNRLYCKEQWDAGKFGHFVYGEGEYYHDMSHGFYEAFQFAGGDHWKSQASFPPMLYPTHSVAMVLSVTGARMTHVSCLGYTDRHEDGIFRAEVSRWGNCFSNQSALFRTSDGGMARINEFRRVGQSGGRSVRLSLYGTEGSFEEQSNGAIWTDRTSHKPVAIEDEVRCGGVHSHAEWTQIQVNVALENDFRSGFGRIHQKYRSRLPESYRIQPNGHEGSHQFLTDDFITAVVRGVQPDLNIWTAARYNAPGIVAHQSSQKDGEQCVIPDFGNLPGRV
ncbi:MAG: Gfo/Idh/MocA family oxidoreductase [Candidatus Methylacidiphilales bacterium]|nr:Gfo/Idh/MocA family oxidoreductase [Candidatus Methylacidiphilales bacterium]